MRLWPVVCFNVWPPSLFFCISRRKKYRSLTLDFVVDQFEANKTAYRWISICENLDCLITDVVPLLN